MILNFKNQIPFIEGVNLSNLTKTIETPFYIYSQNKIIDSFQKIQNTIKTNIYYALKANSNLAIISLMKSLGAGVDTVSIGEIMRSLEVGINPNKIIFEGVGKSKNDIEFALRNNIRQINIESIEELKLINELAHSLKISANIGIRFNPDIDALTLDKITTGRKKDKFGINLDKINEICLLIKNSKSINLKGISCHIGSQINDPNIYEKVFIKMKKASEIMEQQDLKINHLDLGGGFGVTYENEKEIDLKIISNLLDKIFENKYEISFEPGRYLVANAGVLITKILITKTNDEVNFLITDAGMQTLLRPALYNVRHKIIPFEDNAKKQKYTIAGPICESTDIFAKDFELPIQSSGNYLAICDTGAYGFVMASNYNSRNLPTELLINDNNYAVIRKKENISEIIKKDILPDWLKN